MIVTVGRAYLSKYIKDQSLELMKLLKDNGYTLSADPEPNRDEFAFSIIKNTTPRVSEKELSE